MDNKLIEVNSDAWNNQRDILVIFSHEWAIGEEDVQREKEEMCSWIMNEDYKFTFLEDM